jgi:hypothetical protein
MPFKKLIRIPFYLVPWPGSYPDLIFKQHYRAPPYGPDLSRPGVYGRSYELDACEHGWYTFALALNNFALYADE